MVKQKGDRWLFHLRCPGAEHVHLAGDFNGWSETAHPMREVDDGVWEIELALKPGTHRFRYLTSNQGWVSDWAAHGMEPNQNGDWDFTVHVPEAGDQADADEQKQPQDRSGETR